MLKRALCLIAAMVFSAACTVSAFADSAGDTPDTTYGSGVTYEGDASDEGEALSAEEFALENDDPQYGKYMDSLSGTPYTFSADGAVSRLKSSGYTNTSLVHDARFDGMDKVWGIDVSYFQYDIDWNKVKEAGIDFAIVRVGYRGYGTTGQLVHDYKFEDNINGAIAAGLEVGVYFYTQAINTTEAVEEADFVLSYIKDYDLDLPVYYDIESVDYDTGRLDSANLTKAQKTALCTAFCDRIISKGYDAGVYANMSWLTYQIDGAALGNKYPIWLAHYTTKTTYTGVYDTWQFTGSGSISGINTAVDINVQYRDDSKLDQVEGFSLTANGTTADLSWSAVNNAQKYQVSRYNPSDGKYLILTTTTSTKATINLYAGDYAYCVRAVGTYGGETIYGDYSEPIYARKNKIQSIKMATTSSVLKIVWNEIANAAGYQIFCSNKINSGYQLCATVTSTSYKKTGASPATCYYYEVRPYFVNGTTTTYGIMSDPIAVITKPSKASAPTFTSAGSDSITISWNKLANVSGYQIAFYSATADKYVTKATVGSGTLSATITGLNPNSTHKAVVRGYVEYGGKRYYGEYSDYTYTYTAPATPQNMYAKVLPATATFTWDAAKGASAYSVYKKVGNNLTLVGSTTKTTYNIIKPSSGADVSYVVKAYKTLSSGQKLYSAYSNETIFSMISPATPTLKLTKSGNSVTCTWNTISGAKGYRLYRYDETKQTYVSVVTLHGNLTSYTINNLSKGTTYKFKVKAFTRGTSSILWGSASSAKSVTI